MFSLLILFIFLAALGCMIGAFTVRRWRVPLLAGAGLCICLILLGLVAVADMN